MSSRFVIDNKNGLIQGEVNFNHIIALRHLGENYIQESNQSSVYFDFSQLICNDSSVFALMLAWMRFAKKNNKTLQFDRISPLLMRVARIYGIENLLPIKREIHG